MRTHSHRHHPLHERALSCRRQLAGACLAVIAVAGAGVMAAEQDYTTYDDQVVEHRLANGLRLLILERHNAPVVAVHSYVDVGSVDEHVGITGVAHMMEHMAFKGTDRIGTSDFAAESVVLARVDGVYAQLEAERGKGAKADPAVVAQLAEAFAAVQKEADAFIVDDEWSKAISSFGGVGLNASTSWDATNYFVQLPVQFLEGWICLESERFQFPVFREFYKERDVVKEERRMRVEDRAIGKLIELHLATCYTAHPYQQPTIGYMSDLDHLTRGEGETFFKSYYHPGNIILGIVGDVTAADVIAKVDHYFGDIPAGPARKQVGTIEPTQQGQRRVDYVSNEQPIVVVGFHKPSASHPDDAVYDVLAGVLANGRTSRLYRSLVDEKKIALTSGAFSGLPGRKYPNQFSFYALPLKGENGDYLLDECEEALIAEVLRLQRELVSEEELARVKTNARAEFIRSLSSNDGLASALCTFEAIRGDWRDLFTETARLDAVTREDLQRVARATLVETNQTISRIIPPSEPAWTRPDEPKVTKAVQAAGGGAAAAPASSAAPESAGGAKRTPTPGGNAQTPQVQIKVEQPRVVDVSTGEPVPPAAPVEAPAAPQEPGHPEEAGNPQEPGQAQADAVAGNAPQPAAGSVQSGPAPQIPVEISLVPARMLAKGQMYDTPGFGVERPSDDMVERVNALIDRLDVPAQRKPARDEIIRLGAQATPVLMMRKDDASFTIRWEVVNCGGYIADPKQYPSICENVITDENPHVRWRGMWALSEFNSDVRGIQNIFRWALAHAENHWVHWNVAIALTMCNSAESLPVIHEGLARADNWQRWEAINALGRIGNCSSAEFLEPLLSAPEVRDRQEVAMTLGNFERCPKGVELLTRMLRDPKPGIRWRAAMSLKKLRANSALPDLIQALEGETDGECLKHMKQAIDHMRGKK